MAISSIRFINYKAFKNYSLSLQDVNILVGPNNSGKSTIISAFRVLDYALKVANARKATRVETYEGTMAYGHVLSPNLIPTSIENVHTNYSEENSKIEFRLVNKNTLTLLFGADGRCSVYWNSTRASVNTPAAFFKEFPINIQVVPVLGPLEQIEEIVTDETVKKAAGTPRAARHFRNYWYKNSEGFDHFKDLIEKTWPGMSIKPPEFTSQLDRRLVMFCSENRQDRELYWAGFGFQIWCQLLTHISRVKDASLIVIDEPEVYLHPDVQRQLLGILREISPDIVLATHSTEILGEADPSEILLIDKSRASAQRLRDVEGVQQALKSMGSIQNITLAQLARTRKILFVEGSHDYKIIRRFAKILGLPELAAGVGLTALESGGFTSHDKVKALAWGIKSTLGAEILVSAIYDRDYWCNAQIIDIQRSLEKDIHFCHIHSSKEIENYLIKPAVLTRAVEKALTEKENRSGVEIARDESVLSIVERISLKQKTILQGQYVSKYTEYYRPKGKDAGTLNTEALTMFEEQWNDLDARMTIVCGKEFLASFRSYIEEKWGITLTDTKLIDEYKPIEIPEDFVELIKKIESFRTLE